MSALLRGFRPDAFAPERFYAEWRERGIDYGPALQGVAAVQRGDGAVLAQLRIPDAVADTLNDFALHPALLDSAMQCMRLLDEGEQGGLVFAIKSAEFVNQCTPTMWARVRRADDVRADRIDIDLIAEDGTVCLRLQGIAGRRAERASEPAIPEPVTASTADAAVMLLPGWEPVRAPAGESETAVWPRSSESVGIIAASREARETLAARFRKGRVLADRIPSDLDHLVWVAPDAQSNRSGDSILADQSAGTLHAFRTVKALLAAGYGDRPLGLTLITQRAHAAYESEDIDPTHAGVAGLAGTVAKEYPNWRVRVADVERYDRPTFTAVLASPPDADGNMRLLRDGLWHQQRLMPVRPDRPTSSTSRIRPGGTYVIVGGAGSLGTVISEYLIRRYRAQVVWLGRRPWDARIEIAAAEAAASGGPAPLYLRADATSAESLRAAREEILRRFGVVHGVIHSGLVFSGASVARMSDAQFEDVLRGKVDASVRLLEVFGDQPLDFALSLSSINSYLKAVKQANYAAACTFLDSFALSTQRRYGIAGKVLNLGYCFNNAPSGGGSGGAVVSADAPLIQPEELVAAIERLCAAPVSQLTSMKFSPALNSRGISIGDDEVILPAAPPPPDPTPADPQDPRAVFSDLELVRARTAELTALAI